MKNKKVRSDSKVLKASRIRLNEILDKIKFENQDNNIDLIICKLLNNDFKIDEPIIVED